MTSLKTMYVHQIGNFVKGRIKELPAPTLIELVEKELDKICEKCTRPESYCTGDCLEIQIARKEIKAKLKEQL